MLNQIIRIALNHRLAVLMTGAFLIFYGFRSANQLSIDVLPDITRPRVAVITEAPGYATEEVERFITKEIELALNGASGVVAIRSSSDIGLSVIQVEFDWGQDVFRARQIAQERLATIQNRLPKGIEPKLAPNSTLLEQIMMVSIWSEDQSVSPIELRSLADWTIRRRLMQIQGVAQVMPIGGGKKQFQVLIDPHALHNFEINLLDVEKALSASNLNVAGGYLNQSSKELVVRGLGRISTVAEIEKIVVKPQTLRSVLVEDVARVVIGERVKRGDAAVNGRPAVVMTIQKQPDADTRKLTDEISAALLTLQPALPKGVRTRITYQQKEFIDYSVGNLVDAIRDGSVLVIVVLIIFLLNIRTTFITLTAIPLSLLTTFLVFRWYGFTINVMTLGGIAVALGELVDDAIVDVENIYKRLRQNALNEDSRKPILRVIFSASVEVRSAIINSTIIVILVFAPLFALSGIQGRLFAPLGVAYIVSILASTVVSLTVTPVLSFYLLGQSGALKKKGDPLVLHWTKKLADPIIRTSLSKGGFFLFCAATVLLLMMSSVKVWRMGKDLLPPFDEGATQANLFLPAGASLEASQQMGKMASQKLEGLLRAPENPNGPIVWYTSRFGRAEEDEHVMGVNVTEITMSLNPNNKLSQDEMKKLLEAELAGIPGAEIEIEQPIAHLISHMVSGVAAEIGIKIFGDDLLTLKMNADRVKEILSNIEGLTNPIVEQQQMIPQLRIRLKPHALARYGLNAAEVNLMIETAMQGRVTSTIMDGEQQFDLLLRYDENHRQDLDNLNRMPVETSSGIRLPLSEVADIYMANGPSTIKRENSRRRIIVRVNTVDRDLVSAVNEIQRELQAGFRPPQGYFYEISGEYQTQKEATRNILMLSAVSLLGVIMVLYANFHSMNHVLQILVALPIGFIGGVIGLGITGQTLSIAAMVGFISLGGIAIRNGILLIESFERQKRKLGDTKESVVAGSLDRLSPVLMTTLTTGFGLLPLVVGGNLPGKEILYPVATVILGGLITSAIAEFLIRPGLYWYLGRIWHSQQSDRELLLSDDASQDQNQPAVE